MGMGMDEEGEGRKEEEEKKKIITEISAQLGGRLLTYLLGLFWLLNFLAGAVGCFFSSRG